MNLPIVRSTSVRWGTWGLGFGLIWVVLVHLFPADDLLGVDRCL